MGNTYNRKNADTAASVDSPILVGAGLSAMSAFFAL